MSKLTTGKKIAIVVILIILTIGAMAVYAIIKDPFNWKSSSTVQTTISQDIEETIQQEDSNEDNTETNDETIKIVDVNSKTRPYAIVVNNTPVAVKVQTRFK